MAQQTFTPLSNMEISAFCSQMAMIRHSGLSFSEGISLMLEQPTSTEEAELLTYMKETLQATGSFPEALAATHVFPEYLLQMVQIGDNTGKDDEVMEALSAHYERENNLAQAIKSAVTYPLIMIFLMLLVIFVLLTRVMPIFNQVFLQLGSEMTGFSKAILDFGMALNSYSVVLIVLIALLTIAVLYFSRTKSGRAKWNSFSSHISWLRSFTDKICACRFASGMALTLSSGISPEKSLSFAAKLIDDSRYLSKLDACQNAIENGLDLGAAFLENSIFSGVYAHMITIGYKTGSPDKAMQDVASRYQEEIDQKFAGLMAALEPTLVIILSLVVGIILLSVMLPLMGIMSNL